MDILPFALTAILAGLAPLALVAWLAAATKEMRETRRRDRDLRAAATRDGR